MQNVNLDEYQEKVNSLLQEFDMVTHIASHDLRDPLRQAVVNCKEIISNADLVSSKELAENSLELINLVINKIDILRNYSYLIDKDFKKEPVDSNLCVRGVLADLENLITINDAKITCQKLPIVNANKRQLEEVFKILIQNAIKFKSTAKLNIEISVNKQDSNWLFCVEDNGIGLDPVYKDLIFSLFQKLDSESNKSFGVGLAFAKKIINNHQGQIWYLSQEGKGSKFYFTLPI